MSDDIEQRLRDAFHGGSLPPAPASLVDALQRVPDAAIRSRRSGGGRSLIGLLVAAAVIATIGAFAVTGGSFLRPGPPTPTLAPLVGGLRLEYQLRPADGFTPGSDLTGIVSTLEARIATTGVVGATVEADGVDRIVVSLPGVTEAEPMRKLLGQTGRIDFVPLGSNAVSKGQTIDLGQNPSLFSGDEIASAVVSTDDSGQPAIDLTLDPEGTRLFADHTARNIGSFFAITMDGVVLTAPMIQGSIPNGEVRITSGAVDGIDANEASTLAAIIESAPLQFPIYEIASQPPSPGPSAP